MPALFAVRGKKAIFSNIPRIEASDNNAIFIANGQNISRKLVSVNSEFLNNRRISGMN